ncbi:MAG: DUF3150 domain-containing protein [Succinivibrio sp.]|nr:DUF3150 domain-containing protein [Succinivibrio sp.]
MTTTQNTTATATTTATVAPEVLNAYQKLLDRANATEVVIAEFRVMDSFSILPKDKIKGYLSSLGESDDGTSTNARFTGEVFSKAELAPLVNLRMSVTTQLQRFGVLVGKCCSYAVPTAIHKEVVTFLNQKREEYNNLVDGLLTRYDSIVAAHKQQILASVSNEEVKNTLLGMIPSKEEIKQRHRCQYTFYKGQLPNEEDVACCTEEILAAATAQEETTEKFLKKVTSLFEGINFSSKIGKVGQAFDTAVSKALSYESSTKLVLAGTEYEGVCNVMYQLLNEANTKLCCVYNNANSKNLAGDKLLTKYKRVSHILSSAKNILDYNNGAIPSPFLEQQQSYSFADATSNTDDESVFDEALQEQAQATLVTATANIADVVPAQVPQAIGQQFSSLEDLIASTPSLPANDNEVQQAKAEVAKAEPVQATPVATTVTASAKAQEVIPAAPAALTSDNIGGTTIDDVIAQLEALVGRTSK